MPQTRPSWRSSTVYLATGFAVLVGVVTGTLGFVARQEARFDLARHSATIELRVAELVTIVERAETGQRGYLLTGESIYLEPYHEAVAGFGAKVAELRAILAERPSQAADLDRLEAIMAQKFAEQAATVERFRTGRSIEALGIVESGRGRSLMEEARAVVDAMRAREETHLAERLAEVRRDGANLRTGVLLALLVILILGFFSVRTVRTQTAAVLRSRDAVLDANARLLAEAERRETLELQLRQAQKMEAIGQLTGGLAHDFNNMLAVVMGGLTLARKRIATGRHDEVEPLLDGALDGAERAAQLTRRLLAFARRQPLAPEQVDVNRLVSDMSDLLGRTLGEAVRLETVLAGGLWRALADPSQIENAVLNLAVNARDAMPDGGRLTIETRNAHLDEEYAAAHAETRAGQYVMIAVTDTGTGMSAEVLAQAFDPFFTTKETGKGTGLGLSQVYGFARQSGGHVRIYSEPGQGTTVRLYLPRDVAPVTAAQALAARALPRGQDGEVVLVVEDEDRVREMSSAMLRELGYGVIHAASAAEALALLERQPEISLLFTDIVMPDTNGRQLADAARRLRPDLPVLFTTGYTRNAIIHNGVLDAGVQLISKPFTLDQLATKVREVLG